MPQRGETVAEGTIVAWFKAVGDEIKEGDNLFEVETDKVTLEVQAVVAGRLSEIRIGPGITAKVGEVVAVVRDGGEAKSAGSAEAPQKAAQWRSPFEEVSTPTERYGPAKGPDGIRVTARAPTDRSKQSRHHAAYRRGQAAGRRSDRRAARALGHGCLASSLAPALP
jgi:pyruvate/2-oxoglutarate dehydrogenase complex dihydrolipoamide acyltransferase (E2) component